MGQVGIYWCQHWQVRIRWIGHICHNPDYTCELALPSKLLQLQPPQWWIYKCSARETHIITGVPTILSDESSNGPNVPYLGHGDNRAGVTNQKCHESGNTQGQLF